MSSKSVMNSSVQQASLDKDCAPHDSEDEYEEEEHLVSVELTGIIDSDILEKCNNKCKILGINTEKPFLQVDKYVFAGEYEDALGTCVVFEETVDQGDGDKTKPKLKYKCHTVKKLNMTRTFLTEKKEGDDGAGGKIEWFQIKEDSSASWPQMICSFAQENEDANESASEEDDNEQLEESTEDTVQVEQTLETDKQNSDLEETGCSTPEGKKSDSEGKVHEVVQHMDTDNTNGGTSISTAEQEQRSETEDAGCAQEVTMIQDQTT